MSQWKMPTIYVIIFGIIAVSICICLVICIIRRLCRCYRQRDQRDDNESTVPLSTFLFNGTTRDEPESEALPPANDNSVQSGDARHGNILYLVRTYSVPAQVPSITPTRPDEPPLALPEAARCKASTHHSPLAPLAS